MEMVQAITTADTVPMFYDKTGIKLNIMISYAYQQGNISDLVKRYRSMIKLLYLDSGAYSAFTGKTIIDIDEYGIFLKKFGHYFDYVFSLDDSLDDWQHNNDNQMHLESILKDKPFKPIPVVHDPDDPFSEFFMYVNEGHTYIALGSMGARKKIPLDVLGKIRKEHPDIRVHMFGNMNMDMLKKYRPYSADSAGWAHQGGYGAIYYWIPSENRGENFSVGSVDTVTSKKFSIKKSKYRDEVETFLREKFGYTLSSIVSSAQERWIVNLYYYTQVEAYLNSLETPVSDTSVKSSEENK